MDKQILFNVINSVVNGDHDTAKADFGKFIQAKAKSMISEASASDVFTQDVNVLDARTIEKCLKDAYNTAAKVGRKPQFFMYLNSNSGLDKEIGSVKDIKWCASEIAKDNTKAQSLVDGMTTRQGQNFEEPNAESDLDNDVKNLKTAKFSK